MKVHIRPGTEADLPALMQCIRELAEYERAPQEVDIDVESLGQDWAKERAFDFLVAESHDEVVGIALYYPRYSTWKGRCFYLEDLYVKPAYRNMGTGLALLEAVGQKAREAGAIRLDWQVVDWNTPAVRFYEKLGAHIERNWWNCKMKL